MSAPKKKNLGYQKFTLKNSMKADAIKSKAKTDSVSGIKLLEAKYRSAPILLLRGKSKMVAKVLVGKKPGTKNAPDAAQTTPTKKAFYLGGKPMAYQG